MKTLEQDQRILTLAEAANFLRISQRTTWKLARNRDLPSFRCGVQHRFLVSELEAWAVSQRKDFE